jgi:hypothetical protein
VIEVDGEDRIGAQVAESGAIWSPAKVHDASRYQRPFSASRETS